MPWFLYQQITSYFNCSTILAIDFRYLILYFHHLIFNIFLIAYHNLPKTQIPIGTSNFLTIYCLNSTISAHLLVMIFFPHICLKFICFTQALFIIVISNQCFVSLNSFMIKIMIKN